MKISYKWLKDYIDTDLTPQQLEDILTQTGLEVGGIEEVESIKGGMRGLVIGQVVTCEQHANSDHLSKTTVDVGHGEILQLFVEPLTWQPVKKWWWPLSEQLCTAKTQSS